MDGRVSVRDTVRHAPACCATTCRRPTASPFHQGRLFVGECREGGRLMEFDLAGGAAAGPAGERAVAQRDGGRPRRTAVLPGDGRQRDLAHRSRRRRGAETVATGLGVPDSVKFDADGFIVSTQVASGQVLRIDPRTGEQTVLAQLTPGLDNCTFVDGRLFVSNFTGEITEILGGGETATMLPGALNWPLDLAVGDDGRVYVADGTYFYALQPDGSLQTVGMLFSPGYPGLPARAGARRAPASSWSPPRRPGRALPARRRRNRLSGRRFRPALRRGDRAGRRSSPSSRAPAGCCRSTAGRRRRARDRVSTTRSASRSTADGDVLVAESGAGRVVRVTGVGHRDRRRRPATARRASWRTDGALYIVDAGAKAVIAVDLATGARTTIATGLPVGPPPGVEPKPLQGHAAVLRPAGTVRGNRRGTRRHAVRLGRRRGQRAGAAQRTAT